MKKVFIKRTVVTALSMALATSLVPGQVRAAVPGSETSDADDYQLVWSDEFDGGSLNTDDWNVETHEPGWVNAELQRYTSLDEGNIEVSDGTLKIKPHIVVNEAVENETEEEEQEVSVKETDVDFNFGPISVPTSSGALQINFGAIKDFEDTSVPANVTISEVSLVDVTDEENPVKMISSFDGWYGGGSANGKADVSYPDGKANLNITSAGNDNWHVQIMTGDLGLEDGHTYAFHMKASSDVDRAVEVSLLDPNNEYYWYGGKKAVIEGSGAAAGSTGSTTSGGYGEITSGRITTQYKHDYTYGRFEARAKVPVGRGYLPAFWLMATDEGNYGQWPKCGEIDIMEVMGQDTGKSYHTVHYGYDSGNGHKENQDTKIIGENGYSDDFHVFRVDWDPGKITWYVDDEEVYTTSDWYTGTDDGNQITYPAPFDQNFYIILNLAVGGSWVGYPGEEEKAAMNDGKAYEIDYVRVYRKSDETYEKEESEVTKPVKEITFREADSEGNYVVNGDFAKEIGLDGAAGADKDNWLFHTESDAKDSQYALSSEGITITPSVAGSQDYSVQLKQQNVPMYKGWEYELTFDAYSTEERSIIVDVEGPDRNWTRYLKDTTVNIGPEKQTYTLNFTMADKNDPNGSLEFNLGKQGSTAPVTISNVKLVHKSGEEIKDDGAKTIRPDGNYIYNGSFDQGEKRLGYWEIEDADKAYVSATNQSGVRELKVVVPEGGKTVTVKQSELSPIGAGKYTLSFNARCADESSADGLTVKVAGKEYSPKLGVSDAKYSEKISFETDNTRAESNVEILFKKPGTYYLDNLFFTESALIKNGSFNAGLAGFSPYIYDTVKANYVIDSMNGNDNAFAITIEDTVSDTDDNCWYVQLNQDGVTLEQGKSYRVSFKAKSSIDRVIKYSLQEFEGNWTNYSGTGSVEIGNEWKTFTHEFKMENPTDTNTRFNITMGSVDGIRITQQHSVYIDDIELEEITEASQDPDPENPDPENPGEITDPDDPDPSNPGEITNPDDPDPSDPGEITNPDEPGNEDPQPEEPSHEEPKPTIVPPVVKVVKTVVKVVVKTVTKILKSIFSLFR